MFVILLFYFLLASTATTTVALREVEHGASIEMNCIPTKTSEGDLQRTSSTETTRPSKFMWLKNGEPLKADTRFRMKSNASILEIRNAGSADVGLYACMDITKGKPGTELMVYNVSMPQGKNRNKTDQILF